MRGHDVGALAADLAAVEVEVDDALGEQPSCGPGTSAPSPRIADGRRRWHPPRCCAPPTASASAPSCRAAPACCCTPSYRQHHGDQQKRLRISLAHRYPPTSRAFDTQPRSSGTRLSYATAHSLREGTPHRFAHLALIRLQPLPGEPIGRRPSRARRAALPARNRSAWRRSARSSATRPAAASTAPAPCRSPDPARRCGSCRHRA